MRTKKNAPSVRGPAVPLALLLIAVSALRSMSENVTLTTSYPSPAGIYQNLTVTGNAVLARDGGGRVGVGTNAPQLKMHVIENGDGLTAPLGVSNENGGGGASTDLRVGQNVRDTNTAYAAVVYWNQGYSQPGVYGRPSQAGLVAAAGAVNGLAIATNADAPIKFHTRASGTINERMRIAGDGRVGIGTTAPAAQLDVQGGPIRAGGGLILPTSAPASPVAGQMWIQ